MININVIDENDNFPIFETDWPYFSVFENVLIGTEIGRLNVTDRDSGVFGEILFSTDSQHFTVNNFGMLFSAMALDREEEAFHDFLVLAEDGGGSSLNFNNEIKDSNFVNTYLRSNIVKGCQNRNFGY